MTQQAIEDYLKTIYRLAEQGDSPVSTSRIAEARTVKPASVTNMMQRLAAMDLVHYEKSRGVRLTEAGEKIALETLRHHRLIELFLTQKLGFGWEEVHEQAEVLEHVISEKLEERIADVLGHPQYDPHGDPIPSKDGELATRYSEPLSALEKGCDAVVLRVTESKIQPIDIRDLLSYLAELGIVPGAQISVIDVAPFDGPLTLEIDETRQVISHHIAEIIRVQPRSALEN